MVPILGFDERAGLRVDLDQLVGSRALIQANSGGGKSRMLRYLLEQSHGRIQQIVLDPEGEFASLRERFPYLLAGRDGDVPADPKTAKVLARRLLELGASAVIDLYDLGLDERQRFVKIFLDELMHLPRALWRPLLVAIDEAHKFCPERGSGEAGSTQSVITLCTQGRKRGFAALLATQRISKLHKDAAAELLNVLIGRTGLDLDAKRAGDVLGFEKDRRLTLRDLEPGDFYAFGPAIARSVTLVRSGPITTTHPEPGKIAPPAPPPPEKIRKLVAQLTDLAAQAKQETATLEEKEAEIVRLRGELRRAQKPATEPAKADPASIGRAVNTAVERSRKEWEKGAAASERALRLHIDAVGKKVAKAATLAQQLASILSNGASAPAPMTVTSNAPAPIRVARPPREVTPRVRSTAPRSEGGSLPPGERATLTAACQYPDGVTRKQLTILTGYKRSSRDAYIQRLKAASLVEVQGDRVFAAEGAEEHLGDFEPLPTGDALQGYWLNRLPPGEQAILQALIDAYPEALTRDELSEGTDYKRSSRDAYIQRLKARQIIDIEGGSIRAAALLFDGEG